MKTRRFWNRSIAAGVSLAMLLSSLAACGTAGGEGDDTTTTEHISTDTTTESVTTTAAPEPGTPVALEGTPIELTSDFVIVSSDNQSDAMLMLANALKNKIKSKTGLTLSMGHVGSPKDKEIVLGYIENRAACASAYDLITASDYNVYAEGTQLVLGAWTNDNLSAAADLLVEKALVKEGDRWMIYPHQVSYGLADTAGVDLSQYRIVYAANASDYVKKTVVPYLQQTLQEQFGASLAAVTDAESPVDYEIVVGNTNRASTLAASYLEKGEKQLEYFGHAILAEGTRIYLTARADFALYHAVSSLCEQATPEVGPTTFCLKSNEWSADAPSADTDDDFNLADGADIRVMSYNILHQNWSNVVSNLPIEGRDTRVANIVMYYMPDVLGIQEVSALWHQHLNKVLVEPGLYAKACEKTSNKSYNMTTFLYNTATVKLLDFYVEYLDQGSDIRVFSVAVFEKLSDGTQFVVTNTHPAPTGQAENYARNWADMMRIAKEQLEKYKGLPVIMTGDFNTKEQSSHYAELLSTLGVTDAKYSADVLVKDYDTFLNPAWGGTIDKGPDRCIDHIFVNEKADAKLFNVVIDHDVEKTSDHLPIYADIDLK